MPDLLSGIADNPQLFEALKVVLEKQFENETVTDHSMSDEQLGQMFRARLIGLKKLREGFEEINRHKSLKESVRESNPAR